MKKVFTLVLIVFSLVTIVAQDQSKNKLSAENKEIKISDQDSLRSNTKKYNKWSVNANVGYNVPVGPFTTGYFPGNANYFLNPNYNHLDFNVRKMFNTKFGLMWGVSYDKFSSSANSTSIPFSNFMFGTSLQGVINIHRALNWEQFTNTFGLQMHFGPGLTFLNPQVIGHVASKDKNEKLAFDNIYNVISGATVLIKVSNRLALDVDYSMSKNFSHHVTIDGRTKVNLIDNRTGIVHYATVGATLYLGKKQKHADWYWENKADEVGVLSAKIVALEEAMKDANKDGLPDRWDTFINIKNENAPASNVVIEGDKYYSNVQALNMINSQFVSVFFDFDISRVSAGSISNIFFVINYMKDNPSATVDVIGYADELGNQKYNYRLSEKRANNVAEMIVRSGIEESRLKVVIKGADNSVPKESELARQLVRRVVFKVN